MIKLWTPETMPQPASRYSHVCAGRGGDAAAGDFGPGGCAPGRATVAVGLADQLDAALANVDRALGGRRDGRANLMKITVYLTENSPEAVATYRARRDVWVGDGPGPGGDAAGRGGAGLARAAGRG
jgi:2-iminobutanoate/2-iminopropanoate deaminase